MAPTEVTAALATAGGVVFGNGVGVVVLKRLATALHDGDSAEAVRQFTHAMAIQPTAVGYLLLARALEQAGRPADAQAARQAAKQLSPNLDEAEKDADGLLGAK